MFIYTHLINTLSFLYVYTLNFESFPVFDSIEPIETFHFLANVDVAALYDPMRSKLQSPCFHEACRKEPWRSTQRSRKCYSLQAYWLALCTVCNTRVRSLATMSFLQIRCPSKIIYTYLLYLIRNVDFNENLLTYSTQQTCQPQNQSQNDRAQICHQTL